MKTKNGIDKVCNRCHKVKLVSEFYTDPTKGDGLDATCKVCKSEIGRSKHSREWRKKWQRTDTYKKSFIKCRKKYIKDYPERYKANFIVNNAIQKKILTKEPCLICGETKVHAHHPDYSKPLQVVFLCAQHHKDLHVGKIKL